MEAEISSYIFSLLYILKCGWEVSNQKNNRYAQTLFANTLNKNAEAPLVTEIAEDLGNFPPMERTHRYIQSAWLMKGLSGTPDAAEPAGYSWWPEVSETVTYHAEWKKKKKEKKKKWGKNRCRPIELRRCQMKSRNWLGGIKCSKVKRSDMS